MSEPNTPKLLRVILLMIETRVVEVSALIEAKDEAEWPSIRSRQPVRDADTAIQGRRFAGGLLGRDVLLFVVARCVQDSLELVTHRKIDHKLIGPWVNLVFRFFRLGDLRRAEDALRTFEHQGLGVGLDWINGHKGPAQAAQELVAQCSRGTAWSTTRSRLQNVGKYLGRGLLGDDVVWTDLIEERLDIECVLLAARNGGGGYVEVENGEITAFMSKREYTAVARAGATRDLERSRRVISRLFRRSRSPSRDRLNSNQGAVA